MELSNTMIQRKRLKKLAVLPKGCRILYVQAPAGYGKTVFAAQWLEEKEGSKAAVTLDEYDNTAEDICRKLKYLLEDLHMEDDNTAVSAFTKHPDFDKAPVEFLMRAAASVAKENKASIVIDDLHFLTDVSAQKVMQSFLMRLPAGILICILSRNALPECFSELILKNKLKLITQEQMLFDGGELSSLYIKRNLSITKKQAQEVLAFTEGWPIGINALLLAKEKTPEGSMPKDWLENFLKTHVWKLWDERSREFMIGTCMEESLSEGLCNVLTGESDSGAVLKRLTDEGVFLSRQRDGTYRFHNLFRDFLKEQFLDKSEEYRTEKIRTAGMWYREQGEFYCAVQRFHSIKDYEELAVCFDMLEEMDRAGFDAEQVVRAVWDVLDEEIADRYPQLFFMMAFAARNAGRSEEFKFYADKYYENHSRIVEYNPELAHNIFFMYAMDFRFTLKDILKMAVKTADSSTFCGVRGSATIYFPFYHRSYKDFSQLLPGDIEAEVEALYEPLGLLLGDESAMVAKCIQAGLYYEKGDLQCAQELSLLAAANMQKNFAPETKFCVLVLMMQINHDMRQAEQEEAAVHDIQRMIEEDKAFYLLPNFDAVMTKNQLDSGDADAAQRWIASNEMEVYDQLEFFKLYVYFTTARSYIALGKFDQAIILLDKILEMCRVYDRTTEVIEAELLLAIAFRKKKRGNVKKALFYLEEAIRIAQPLGYEQVFINAGADVEGMLANLKNRTMRRNYKGDLLASFVKRLYIGASEQAQFRKGLTGGRVEQTVQFTEQQKRVMKLMCEGYSYQKIADELGIKFSTVRSHIELIYRKLDVSAMKEAILKIRQLHVLEEY